MNAMRIDILTLFPMMFKGILDNSMMQIAQSKKLVDVRISNIRNFAYDKHHTTDDCPYGGGPGMLLKPEAIFRAVESIVFSSPSSPVILLTSAQGEVWTQTLARELIRQEHLLIICGHYEGIDERVRLGLAAREISIGDYVLTGGEIPAMVILDSTVRLLPGVLGNKNSATSESFSDNLLEYPQYTKPLTWRGMEVPAILRSGHHLNIANWQREMSRQKTRLQRPDLLEDNAPATI